MGHRVHLVALLAVVAACHSEDKSTGVGASSGVLDKAKVTFAPPGPDDGQWTMSAKDYANTRYSQLAELTPGNVNRLELKWSYDLGTRAGFEAAPLVVGSTMYVITPFPNKLFAFDLAKGGQVKWIYDPQAEPASKGVACCDVVNRGGAFYDGKIYYATLDTHVVAVDANTGKEVWKVKLGDITSGETITMAPIVVKGKVLVGNSGGEMGVRGWLQALDAQTGTPVWKAYSTGPDKEVLIGPRFHPFYEQDRGHDLGMTTWPGEKWRQGGGTVWGWLSYDPALDLVFEGTANPGPWNADMRPGDNKWTAGIFARDPQTGEAVSTRASSPMRRSTVSRGSCCCTPSATATSTCSTARPARCCPPIHTRTSRRPAASTSRPAS